MEYALVDIGRVRLGTKLKCDGGFTCMDEGSVKTVNRDPDGYFWVECECGKHGLDGQKGDTSQTRDKYVGFWMVSQ